MSRAALLVAVFLLFTGCSSKDASLTRTSVPPNDGGASADADAATLEPDPTGGRDDKAASCYAACQNGAFTCQTKGDPSAVLTTIELTPETGGCSGTLTTGSTTPNEQSVAMKLDCTLGDVCQGDAPAQPATTCLKGLFSAFSFSYVPKGATAQRVCTRN